MSLYIRPGDTIRVITASGKSKPARVQTANAASTTLTVKVASGAATSVTRGSGKDAKRLYS